MGGKYGSSVLNLVKEVQRGELRQMRMHRLKSRHVPPGTDRNYPTIGVDCNMVINVIGRFKKDPVAALAGFLEEWADHGFVMLPVVDGASPHAKQATMEHIAKREAAMTTNAALLAGTDFVAGDVENDNSSSPLPALLAVPLTTLILVFLPTYFWFVRKGKRKQRRRREGPEDGNGNSAVGAAVPWAPGGWVPFLGHALAYKSDPAAFLASTGRTVGPVFRLNLAGKRMVVVCGPEQQRFLANLPESKLSARQAVAEIGFEQTLGEFNVGDGTGLQRGIVLGLTRRRNGQQPDFVSSLMERLRRALRVETTAAAGKTTTTMGRGRAAGERPPQKRRDFFHLVRRVVLRTMIDWMVAPDFLDGGSGGGGYPAFLEEFMSFQDALEETTAKSVVLPKWVALPALLWPLRRRRLRLQQRIAVRLQRLLLKRKHKRGGKEERLPPSPANGNEGLENDNGNRKDAVPLGFWLEEVLAKHGGNLPLVAESVVGLLFAAHKNPAIGAAQSYVLLHELGTQEDLDQSREEASRLLRSPDLETLPSCRRLERICLETLRLTAHSIGGIRAARQDISIEVEGCSGGGKPDQRHEQQRRRYRIPKGTSVGLAHISSSWNPELWGRNPRRMDTTSRSGEMYRDEYRFTTFSHGRHKCPGQKVAMAVLECTLAILLDEYSVVLPPKARIPPLSFERATLAQREGPVMVTIRPKKD